MQFDWKGKAKRLAGQGPGCFEPVDVDRLTRNWTYTPGRPDLISIARRRTISRDTRPAPARAVLKAAFPADVWAVYFIYAPAGVLTPSHRFTIEKLSSFAKLLVVCACSAITDVPPVLPSITDALIWKALPGFDFSGYALGLLMLAERSPGCDVVVMNDSVFGPFCDLDPRTALWDITGFTASSSIENHVQSYAFLAKDWTAERLTQLREIFPAATCYDNYEGVTFCQEAKLARVAARRMTVGAWWYANYGICADPSVYAALSLARTGFPFLKKSLFTKHAHVHARCAVEAVLTSYGHPL